MDIIELRRLRPIIRAFANSVNQNWNALHDEEACDRYHELYAMAEAASDDPNFKRYVQPLTYWRSGPGLARLPWERAVKILNSANQLFAYLDSVIGPEEVRMDEITKNREQRYLFLKHLHDITGGNEHDFRTASTLGSELGLDDLTTRKIVQYLKGENLIKEPGRDVVNITHHGVVQIEKALQNPNQHTEYFPPVMNMQIILNGTTIHGGLNVASIIQDSYNKITSAEIPDDLKGLLKQLSTEVANMSKALPEEIAEQAARDLNTLTAEVTSKSPRKEYWQLSVEGLKKAAKDIGEIGKPVLELAALIVAVLVKR